MNTRKRVVAMPTLALLVVATSCVSHERLLTGLITVEVQGVIRAMESGDLERRQQAEATFERLLCHFYSGPVPNPQLRTILCNAIAAQLGCETPRVARLWLLRQLERIGRDESVPKLAELLGDDDALVRESARRALQNNPAPTAGDALRAALDGAEDSAWRVALINALAARRGEASAACFAQHAHTNDPPVVAAAIAALADVGDPDALRALWRSDDAGKRELTAAALIRVADRQLQHGQRSAAAGIYRDLYYSDATRPLRVAALRGLVDAEQQAALPELIAVLRGTDDPKLQIMAARLAGRIPGKETTYRLMAELELWRCAPAAQAALLDVLAARGDKKAKLVVYSALQRGAESVRAAALRALQKLGDTSDLALLARTAADSEGQVRDAARWSLARLPGFAVDPAILIQIDRDTAPRVRAELIRALAARHFNLAVPKLLDLARDLDPLVRTASFEALTELADTSRLPQLIALTVYEPDDEVRPAAEDAVVSICLRDDDRERRAAPVLSALAGADARAHAALIRILGRVQGDAALAAVRAGLKDGDRDVLDAAVRALSGWEDSAVLDDLRRLAHDSDQQTHRVLALRGFVRLVRQPGDRAVGETLALLKEALALTERDEDKKLILGALGEVKHLDALRLATAHLTNDTLRDEAAVASAQIARSLAAEEPAAALAALTDILAAPVSDAARQQAQDVLDLIERFDGYIGAWVYAGPYSLEGDGFDTVFATSFPPEVAGADQCDWRPLTAATHENPWIFDLTQIEPCSNCCVYVRTAIRSPASQAVRLVLGSDDAVQAWLNGELVHSHKVNRGLTPGQDQVDVTLHEGRNTLMLKIVNAGGAWAFTCGLRTTAGDPVEGLAFTAE